MNAVQFQPYLWGRGTARGLARGTFQGLVLCLARVAVSSLATTQVRIGLPFVGRKRVCELAICSVFDLARCHQVDAIHTDQ